MTEYGAIKELSIEYPGEYQKQREAKNIAIRAIKEVLEYRKLGTLEELQEAKGNALKDFIFRSMKKAAFHMKIT